MEMGWDWGEGVGKGIGDWGLIDCWDRFFILGRGRRLCMRVRGLISGISFPPPPFSHPFFPPPRGAANPPFLGSARAWRGFNARRRRWRRRGLIVCFFFPPFFLPPFLPPLPVPPLPRRCLSEIPTANGWARRQSCEGF